LLDLVDPLALGVALQRDIDQRSTSIGSGTPVSTHKRATSRS